ncbi:amino acid adenylation domain-containing protein [Polymorphospora sp. NPDC050346]|uniref:non-ribosomal peptide synthetase n=1 Tax=Polymorphospora sp. NPDC050346 TaxID=3155780 RepID=UPI003409A434
MDLPRLGPASAAQHGLWFTERIGAAGSAYHMPLPVRLSGALDADALADACDAVVRRHPVLAYAFDDTDGELALVAAGPPRLTRREVRPADVAAVVRAETLRPFDLRRGPLVRFTLLGLAPTEHLLLVVAHHLVFDGGSKDVLLRELAAAYGARVTGATGAPIPPVPYAGHAADEAARIAATLPAAREFWADRWREPAPVVLPGLTRVPDGVEPGEAVEFDLTPARRSALAGCADRSGHTRFEVLLAAVQAVLHRYGNAAPTVAVDLGTRTAATRDAIGLFVNELPVAVHPDPDRPFADLVAATRAELRRTYPVRVVPLARAVDGLRPRPALAPVSVSYRRRTGPDPVFAGLRTEVRWTAFNHAARNALHVQVVDGPDRTTVNLQHAVGGVDRDSVDRIAGHLTTLLDAATAAPDTPLRALPVLGEPERRLLLAGWQSTAEPAAPATDRLAPATGHLAPATGRAAGPLTGTVPELVAGWAAATPDAPAVVFAGAVTTYAELDRAAAALAGRLRAAGAGPGTRVAVRLRRSPDLLAGLLAVLRTGAAYVPLDPDHPPARRAYVLDDTTPAVLLTAAGTADDPATHRPVVVHVDAPSGPATGPDVLAADPDAVAYVVHTSGSTGRPKGVEVTHRSLAHLLDAMRAVLTSGPADGWLALASATFDMAKPELFLPLVTGGRIVLAAGDDTRDGAALLDLVRRHGVSHVHATPTTWRLLLDAGLAEPVVALCGAEPLPPALARELRPRVRRLFNLYGPTEATVWATVAELPDPVDAVTIGRPLPGARAYVLDPLLRPAPVGVPGEIHIAGTGVARGYLHRPGLTAARFRPDPYGPPGSRLYATGDLGRWRPDGRLEFLGRIDRQVKVRGHRVEPGEIEATLDGHPDVHRSAVVLRADDGRPRLVAYVEFRPGRQVTDADLRRFLRETLPGWMVPEVVVPLAALPTTPNGKLDRAALPAPATVPAPAEAEPEPDGAEPAADGAEPEPDGLGAAVTEIWRQVLRVDRISPHDDLFDDLGGHSLSVTQIAARMRRQLGVDLPLHVFFDTPTVAGVLAAVAGDDSLPDADDPRRP